MTTLNGLTLPEIWEKVKKIISSFGVLEEKIVPEANLDELISWPNQFTELADRLEKEFGFSLTRDEDDQVLISVQTVGDLKEFCEMIVFVREGIR